METDMLEINADRLWQRLMDMARIGATKAGGCNRQALTDEDAAGRGLFLSWAEQAGCSTRLDEIGNLFIRREGRDKEAGAILIGSHLDTQPTGGKYDGIYGVLAGLELIETLNDRNIETDHPIEVVVWTNEEGCRFSTAMMGSAVWAGVMTLEAALSLQDSGGVSVAEALQATNQKGSELAKAGDVKAAFELHIEQGPILEAENRVIGIVTGVQNMSRHWVRIHGQEVHAGPTPMQGRRDPMRALSRFLPRLYEMAEGIEGGRITFGIIEAQPASNNTVPGLLTLSVDIRHPDKAIYDRMVTQMHEIIEAACADEKTPVEMEQFFHAPGVVYDAACLDSVRAAIAQFDYPHMEMVSGAGHDACNVSEVAPTAMIFIPCEGGISHNEAEHIETEHATAGANILLHSVLHQACR
jgi:N-carbamoyl-L-amino-acid hydrolase